MSLNESIVEDAALEWFGELGYAVSHGPQLAPGEPTAERDSFSDVVLVERLRAAIRQLNPTILPRRKRMHCAKYCAWALRRLRKPTRSSMQCCAMVCRWNTSARMAASQATTPG